MFWVEGTAVEVSVTIMNPLPFDIKVEKMVRSFMVMMCNDTSVTMESTVYPIRGCNHGVDTVWFGAVT